MLFNSYEFILAFLPATLVVFFLLARLDAGLARLFLLVASFGFYAWWSVEYGLLIVATILVNHAFGRAIQARSEAGSRTGDGNAGRSLLALAIGLNLALLGYFKYRDFFVANVNALAGADWPMARLVLPLAISFHTFQQVAYLVDSRRRRVCQPGLANYALFVLFFPQLIAGPIVHHHQLLPQLEDRRMYRFDPVAFAAGTCFFVLGLAKKLLIADPLAGVADPLFDAAAQQPPTLAQAWVAVLAYAFGLYFDFSGYSDMAIGLARMFGVRLPYNFASPYRATSIIDFWRRWHITLSNWLRDYLYIPLGGNRHGPWRRQFNLAITMLLGGLWHGASWTFVAWGLLHGGYLAANHAWRALADRRLAPALPLPLAWALTMLAVCLAWVFFRSAGFAQATALLAGLAGWNGLHAAMPGSVLGPGKSMTLILAAVIALLLPNTQQLVDGAFARRLRVSAGLGWSAAMAVLLLVSLTQMSSRREFVYFQF